MDMKKEKKPKELNVFNASTEVIPIGAKTYGKANVKKSKVVHIEVGMFPDGLVFYMAENDEDLYEELIRGIVKVSERDLEEYKSVLNEESHNKGFAFVDDESGLWQVIVFTNKKNYEVTLVHELLHVVEKVCAYRDIPISKDTEELRAMMLGYIYEQITDNNK